MKKIRLILGYLLIVIGISINIYNLYKEKDKRIIEKNKIAYTLEKEVSYRKIDNTYDAVLSIPKIDLKKGVYSINDKRNNIEENIMIHKDSIYPDSNNSNVILIAHSGTGPKAIFKELNKLDKDSLIEFYYKHTKYVYKINDIYSVNKNGSIGLRNDINKKTITLITCNSLDKSKQDVYIGYLIDEIKY